MSDGTYTPFVNPNALLSMPVVSPDGSITHGSEPSNTAPSAPSLSASDVVASVLDVNFLTKGIQPGAAAKQQEKTDWQKVAIDVVLVVIGLMLLSRGFGLIGEEGEGVIVQLSNPSKYPGFGHAIQHAKGKGK